MNPTVETLWWLQQIVNLYSIQIGSFKIINTFHFFEWQLISAGSNLSKLIYILIFNVLLLYFEMVRMFGKMSSHCQLLHIMWGCMNQRVCVVKTWHDGTWSCVGLQTHTYFSWSRNKNKETVVISVSKMILFMSCKSSMRHSQGLICNFFNL